MNIDYDRPGIISEDSTKIWNIHDDEHRYVKENVLKYIGKEVVFFEDEILDTDHEVLGILHEVRINSLNMRDKVIFVSYMYDDNKNVCPRFFTAFCPIDEHWFKYFDLDTYKYIHENDIDDI